MRHRQPIATGFALVTSASFTFSDIPWTAKVTHALGLGTAVAHAACGDSTVEAGEDCDDGDTAFANGEACTASCTMTPCGKPTASVGQTPIATDALFALGAAVGIGSCDTCVCDVDGSGTNTATDVLRILAAAVGQTVTLACTACTDVVRHGQLLLKAVIDVPENARAEIQNRRAEVEEDNLTLAADASKIEWPAYGAAGWPVTIGDRTVHTDADGNFSISVPAGTTSSGTIAHPQAPDTPLFELSLGRLARSGEVPVALEFELDFAGPCGMNDDPSFPDPEVCPEILAVSAADDPLFVEEETGHDHAHHAHHIHAAPRVDGARSQTDPANAQTTGPLGTYPAGNQNCCRDYDGGTWDPTTTWGVLMNYQGSTCDMLVSNGCCAGELGSIKNSILNAVGALTPVSCKNNHKGRYCQEVDKGDVAVQVPDGNAMAGGSVTQEVCLGDMVSVTVHNNGCFGESAVAKPVESIFGVLDGANLSGGTLLHYTGPTTYATDQALTYAVQPCVGTLTGTEEDHYTFSADGETTTVVFDLSMENLWQFVPNGSIFSSKRAPISGPDECEGDHVHGPHPCNGAPDPGDEFPCGHGIVAPFTP